MPLQLIESHPADDAALIEDGRTVSYGELRDLTRRTAAGLAEAGVTVGDRVAVVGHNEIGFVTGLLAAFEAGAIACPMAAENPKAVLAERLELLHPTAVVVTGRATDAAEVAAAEANPDLVIGVGAGTPNPDLRIFDTDGPTVGPRAAHETALILQTSGIVGKSRAAMLTAANLAATQRRIVGHAPPLTSGDVSYGGLPLAHVLGLNTVLLATLSVGGSVVLHPDWDDAEALELIERHRVTQVVGVPPMWSAWANAARAGGPGMSSVVRARSGASTLHPNVAQAVFDGFGLELSQGYGLTETAGTLTVEREARSRPGSVGTPLAGVELRLVEDGNEVEPGDRGEVWVRSDSVFQGYLDDPASTAAVLVSDGWCQTGDIGVADDDGTLYLVGRSKDLINVSGFNVSPHEVEDVLEEHQAVEHAVVVGEPHEVTGERVVAYVTAAGPGPVDATSLTELCRDRMSRYKVPQQIHVVERLPLNAIGKRRRSELRAAGA